MIKTTYISPITDTQSFEDSNGKPHIYVAYSHSDIKMVSPELKRFQDYGCDVWSDEIQNSSLFVVFMSENTFKSIHIKNSVYDALEKNISVLPIYLEETELNSELELRLSNMRSISKYKISDRGYVNLLRESFESYGIKMGPKLNMNIFGIDYSFRNPDCPIYNLAEHIYPYWGTNDSDFSSLSDEKYFYYERTAINALCLVKASGRDFDFTDSNAIHLDLSDANNWETFKEAQILFIDIMKDLGWKNGNYDYENKTIPLAEFGGSLADDAQERHMQRIIDSVRKSEL